MPDYDWSRFDVHMRINAPAERVFDSWTTPQGLTSFFVGKASFESSKGVARGEVERVGVGDRYEWTFIHGSMIRGTVRAIDPHGSYAFTFGSGTVTVQVTALPGGTLLSLRQEGIPTTAEGMVHEHLNCRGGWIHFITLLKVRLENGVDGRDFDPSTAGSLATHYRPPQPRR